jgi:hypothetical protein
MYKDQDWNVLWWAKKKWLNDDKFIPHHYRKKESSKYHTVGTVPKKS